MKKLSCDRFLSMLAILLAALVAVTMPARAAMIGDADISFHATRTVLFKGRTYTGPVWAVPGKQRHEQTINGFRLVVILRTDTGTATAILPDLNVYASFPMSRELDLESLGEPVSHGIVAGLPAAKYRLEHEESDGTGADGWLWVGPHHLLLKIDGDYRTAGGNTVPVTASLSHIERGPQDPSLFEIPGNMTALPVEALAPFLGFKMN
jgi:hypothetical protein